MEHHLETKHTLIGIAAILTLVLPSAVRAQTVSQFFGILNATAGVMLLAGVLIFIGGFIIYLSKLGTVSRSEGIYIMQWGVITLFVLAVMLSIIELIQSYFA